MADYTLSIGLSRRTMLAGSVAVPTMAFPVFQALAALPESTALSADPNPDAELLHRISAAEQLRNEHAQVQRLRYRLRKARETHNDLRSLPFRDSHPATWQHYVETFERYAAAVRTAVAIPARTVTGLHAKLSLGVIAARRGGARVYMYEDREWLEIAMADLKRLALNASTAK